MLETGWASFRGVNVAVPSRERGVAVAARGGRGTWRFLPYTTAERAHADALLVHGSPGVTARLEASGGLAYAHRMSG